jgi:prevent-host-death family protein
MLQSDPGRVSSTDGDACHRLNTLTWRSILANVSGMKRVKIGEFRNRASELIRRAAGGETIVILNRDREVAKVVPITTNARRSGGLIGSLAGTADIRGDIEPPIAPPTAWFRGPR